jgi:twitching motility protein PilT
MELTELLSLAIVQNASDLHLSSGTAPVLRVQGQLRRLELPALTAEQVRAMAQAVMTTAQYQAWNALRDVDGAMEQPGLGRFRFNAYTHHRGPALALRHIASHIGSLQELRVPAALVDLVLRPQGLLLVTGPTGSGKSSTLAALLQHRMATQPCHLITIEDPIEFVHRNELGLVHQRELGTHAASFDQALREDPDVIMVGELRDRPTIELAITAAQTGHLVLATVHTNGAAQTIDRLIDGFAAADKEMVRTMLSESLLAVVSQVLCPGRAGGRVAVHEVLVATAAVRNLIRENKLAQLHSVMQTGSSLGMQTLDQALAESVRRQLVIAQQARRLARNPDNIAL